MRFSHPCHWVDSAVNPRYCMIWLHGLGADGHDLAPLARELAPPVATRFVFPHAPHQPVAINGDLPMPAWYNIYSDELPGPQDVAGVHRASAHIQAIIDDVKAQGFDASRMVLAGFSQGGAMTVYTGLRQQQPLAGLIALSCYQLLPQEALPATPCASVFLGHGRYDPVVACRHGQALAHALRQQGHRVDAHDYPMEHSICAQEIADMRHWLIDCGFWAGDTA